MEHINPYDTKAFGSIDRAIILNPLIADNLRAKRFYANVHIHLNPFRHALNVRWQAYFHRQQVLDT